MSLEIAKKVLKTELEALEGLLKRLDARFDQAVETIFGVKVTDVRTQVVYGKEKRMGRFVGRRASWKKAVVQLAADSKIELFES